MEPPRPPPQGAWGSATYWDNELKKLGDFSLKRKTQKLTEMHGSKREVGLALGKAGGRRTTVGASCRPRSHQWGDGVGFPQGH